MSYSSFFSYFIYKAAIYLSITLLIWGSFSYYQNHISPATLPQHTLSNGEQTLIFQTMSHIASKEFYNNIVSEITTAKKQWYVLYYEWVTPGSEENNEDFKKALGVDLWEDVYKNFSKLYGITAQNNNDLLWLVNNLDYNVDVSIDTVMDLYRSRVNTSQVSSNLSLPKNENIQDINSQIIEKLGSLSQRELIVLRYINQSILNFIIKNEWLRNFIITNIANKDIFSVILDDRNEYLVEEILTRKDEKIFITYGLMHFHWVLKLLQREDPRWKIINTKSQQIILQDS